MIVRGYEMVAGLETHVELSTATKIFCGCTTKFGADPNMNCCPICIGLPGTLPKLNKQVVRYAIMAGLATNCEIANIAKMDRKNYVYPDLSKAYQISQFDKPLCEHGYVELSNGRKIRLTRIHIEEDAGKLVHEHGDTFVDYNRGGVPLIEIVTEPDFRSPDEITEYLEKLQLIMKYIGVSDCRMQEGSLRCDVNISVRKAGTSEFGTRTEIKNMNSFTFIQKAVEYEMNRQIDALENGEEIIQETRRYDDAANVTESMRGKEDANDYRYFREPDLVTIATSDEEIEEIGKLLPELPDSRKERYMENWDIPEKDAALLTKYRKVAEYFETASEGVTPKTVCNLILGQIFRRLATDAEKEAFEVKTTPKQLNALVKLIDEGKLRMNLAKPALEQMLDTGKDADNFIDSEAMAGMDDSALKAICQQAVDANPAAVKDYLNGKEKAVKALVGFVMKNTRGAANPQLAEETIIAIIKG